MLICFLDFLTTRTVGVVIYQILDDFSFLPVDLKVIYL